MKFNYKKLAPTTIVIAAIVLFIGFAIINNIVFSSFSLDLTQNNSYTLSKGTKSILSKLDEPIHIRFFYSETIGRSYPTVQAYSTRVIGILKKYQNLSHKKITLEIINPQAFSKEEDQAVGFGIQAIPVSDNGEKLYFGITLSNSTDESKTITFLDPTREAFLEYDLTHMTHELSNPKKPIIGLLNMVEATVNPYAPNDSEWTILDKLKELYQVKNLDSNLKSIDKNIDVLILIHPHGLSDATQYAIDQYLLSGGKAFIFVDPYLEIPGNKALSSNLDKLFKHWGANFSEDKVVLDGNNYLRVPSQKGESSLGASSKLNWIKLTKDALNPDQITTSSLNTLNFISGGEFTFNGDKNSPQFIPLLRSSNNAMMVDKLNILHNTKLITNFVSDNKSHVLAAYITGNTTSAFPNYKDGKQLTKSEKPINVVLVGDVDLLRDPFWIQKQNFFGQTMSVQISDNASFFINTVDQLAGSSDLITLRSRSIADRPFVVVNKLRQKAEGQFLTQEQELNDQLKALEGKFTSLEQSNKGKNGVVLDEALTKELESYKTQMLDTRSKLREVKHKLDQEIEHLGSVLKFIHIILLPIFVIILALVLPKRLGVR